MVVGFYIGGFFVLWGYFFFVFWYVFSEYIERLASDGRGYFYRFNKFFKEKEFCIKIWEKYFKF